jgi:DNA-directed RNA polymerase subunit RPC12/RpoP
MMQQYTVKEDLDLDITFEPGSTVPAYQCANCSKAFRQYDDDGNLAQIPSVCTRCQAPMSFTEVHRAGGFSDQAAEAAAKSPPNKRRDKMMRQAEQKATK